MLNTPSALCGSIALALRNTVLPVITDPFARTQVLAAIYVLNNLALRDETAEAKSSALVLRMIASAEAARADAGALGLTTPAVIRPSADTDGARRSAADADLAQLMGCFAEERAAADASRNLDLAALESRLLAAAEEAVEHDRRLVAPSMMREMSGAGD